jgi:hypothetical protein
LIYRIEFNVFWYLVVEKLSIEVVVYTIVYMIFWWGGPCA